MKIPDSSGLGIGAPMLSPSEGPRLPVSTGTGMGVAGDLLTTLDAISSPFEAAQRENLYSKTKTESFSRLNELYSSLEGEQDPDEIGRKWSEGVASIEEETRQALSGHDRVGAAWGSWFADSSLRTGIAVKRLQRQKIVDQGRATLSQGLETYVGALPLAKEQGDIDYLRQSALADIDAKHKAGIISAQEAQQTADKFLESTDTYLVQRDLSANPVAALAALRDPEKYRYLDPTRRIAFQAKAEEKAAAAMDEQAVESAYSWADKRFTDHEEAVRWFEDPDNNPDGRKLSLGQRNSVLRLLGARAATQRQARAESLAKTERQEQDAIFKAMRSGNFEEAQRIVDRSEVLDYEFRSKITSAVGKGGSALKTDAGVEAKIIQGIRTGEITDKSQILALEGNGLSAKDADKYVAKLEKASVPPGFNPWEQSYKLYKDTFKDDQDMLDLFPEFVRTLDWYAEEEDLAGMQVYDRAAELMERSDPNAVFFKGDRKIKGMFEGGTFPGRQPHTRNKGATPADIPLSDRERISTFLRENKKPVSEANIMAVWKQQQAKK